MKILIPLILILLTLLPHTAKAELVVVVNEKNSISSLSRSQIIDLYMGRHSQFSNGIIVKPIDQANTSSLKELFYTKLVGKSLARINAYWARLKFTGRSKPPKSFSNSEAVQKFIQNNISGIAYLERDSIISNIKVVYSFESL